MGKLLDNKLFGFVLVCALSSLACQRCVRGESFVVDTNIIRPLHARPDASTDTKASLPEPSFTFLSRVNVPTVCTQLTCPNYKCPADSCHVACDCPPPLECKRNATQGFCTCDQKACPACKCPTPKCPRCPCKSTSCPTIQCPPCPDDTVSGCPGTLFCDKPDCNVGCRKPKTCNCAKSATCDGVQKCFHCPAPICPKCPPCPDYYCSPCDCVSGIHDEFVPIHSPNVSSDRILSSAASGDIDPCVPPQGCPPCKPRAMMQPRVAKPGKMNPNAPLVVNFEFYPTSRTGKRGSVLKEIPGQARAWVQPSPAEGLPDTVPFFEEELSPTEGKTQHVLMAGYIITLVMMLVFGASVITQNYMMEECLQIVEADLGDEEEPCL
ncbi:unnamed protein product [Notodromas monacha]|uniref:Uncharacterized protein n=1 Tax=Notodromas monacha TaxID=399045 RepID=A0A7R9GBY2_9CRUS|nr:unnamed protein product [Notodromas monacha]CAG0915533.1 unnamed protein product [Notodromas monacha]